MTPEKENSDTVFHSFNSFNNSNNTIFHSMSDIHFDEDYQFNNVE